MLDFGYEWINPLSLLDNIPEESIALTVYVVGCIVALWCCYQLTRRWPRPLGGMTWTVVMIILCTPTVTVGNNAGIAPAVFGLIYGVITKDQPIIWTNLAILLFALGISLLSGFFWTKYRSRAGI